MPGGVVMPTIPNLPETEKFGTLLTPDMKFYRKYFEELVRLQNIILIMLKCCKTFEGSW